MLSVHHFCLTILVVLASVVTLCVAPCSIENRKRELSVIVSFLVSGLAQQLDCCHASHDLGGDGDSDQSKRLAFGSKCSGVAPHLIVMGHLP